MQLQWVDLIIIGIVGLSALTGLFRGVVKEVIALGIWVVAIWMGYNHSQAVVPYIQPYIQNPTACSIAAFLVILVGVLLAGAILNFILSLVLRRSGLSSIDKILGMCFGFARGVFIVSFVLAVLSMTSLPYQPYVQTSTLCMKLQPVVNWISQYIPTFINRLKSVDSVSGSIGNIIDTIPHP